MKAIVIDGYGGPEKLLLRELPEPQPKPGEALVKVRAAAVNPLDWKIREGWMRFFLRLNFPYVPGSDVAGEVAACGAGVTAFKPGDAVVAFLDPRRGGAYAEFAAAKETAMALKPASMSFAEAASLPIAGCAALQSLRDIAELSPGDHVLVNGAAGGVGHFAVQIAKALRARTTAVCGPASVEFVRSLGADDVIDYSREDFARRDETYDVIFDAVSNLSFAACWPRLARGGVYVATLPTPALLWTPIQWVAGLFGETKRAAMLMVRPNAKDLAFLGRLADEGKLKAFVSAAYPLDRAREAQEQSQKGHTRGKIVLEF